MSVAGIVTFLEKVVYFGRGASEAIHMRELYCLWRKRERGGGRVRGRRRRRREGERETEIYTILFNFLLTRNISLDLCGNLFANCKIVPEHPLSPLSVSGQFTSTGILEVKERASESKLYPTTPRGGGREGRETEGKREGGSREGEEERGREEEWREK